VEYYSSMLIVIPAIIFAIFAQSAVSTTFSKYSQVRSETGYTGKQLARTLLDSHGLSAIAIEPVPGVLSDHFDPRQRVVRLSESTFQNGSVAALGVVAHEVGHVIQMQERYRPMVLRNAVVPIAQFGSSFSWLIFFFRTFLIDPGARSSGDRFVPRGRRLFAGDASGRVQREQASFNATSNASVDVPRRTVDGQKGAPRRGDDLFGFHVNGRTQPRKNANDFKKVR